MTNPQRDKCAELVEQIRSLSPTINEAIPETLDMVNDKREAVRERCDQLIMMLQPITVRYPRKP